MQWAVALQACLSRVRTPIVELARVCSMILDTLPPSQQLSFPLSPWLDLLFLGCRCITSQIPFDEVFLLCSHDLCFWNNISLNQPRRQASNLGAIWDKQIFFFFPASIIFLSGAEFSMQSEKYFNLLCRVISSLSCINAAEVTTGNWGSPARGSEHSSGPCYEDGYQEAPELQDRGGCWWCLFSPEQFRVIANQWDPKGIVKKMPLSATCFTGLVGGCWRGRHLLMSSERRRKQSLLSPFLKLGPSSLSGISYVT